MAIVKPRGIRNNNPGNIRHGSSQWQGMSPMQNDTEYVQFDAPVMGIRAMAKLLKNYQTRYGLNTIQDIIGRWAPPNENLTESYVKAVSAKLGIKRGVPIDLNNNNTLESLVVAIIHHENGQQPYPDATIREGIALI